MNKSVTDDTMSRLWVINICNSDIMNKSVPSDTMSRLWVINICNSDIMNKSVTDDTMSRLCVINICYRWHNRLCMINLLQVDIMNTSVPGDIMSRLWVINTGNSDRDYTIFNTVDVIVCMPTHTGSLSLQSHQKDFCQVCTQFWLGQNLRVGTKPST